MSWLVYALEKKYQQDLADAWEVYHEWVRMLTDIGGGG